jgi:FemAB-related protein (PEP-CTERM system-associated)
MPALPIVNAMTIDVEDYFQVSALAPYIARSEWEERDCRIERNLERILSMLDEGGAHATFFTLGWIAERYPQAIRRIVDNGHELASHGFGHHRATEQHEQAFVADIRVAKMVLEDISGVEVKGYRAPSFSIGHENPWAFDCIERAGYRYSSSIYPIRHDHYGMPDAPRFSHQVRKRLLEVPVTTMRLFDRNWPAGGGGYFRLMPYAMSRWLLQRVNEVDGQPAIFYFHPWEIDADQPRVPGLDAKTRFRHYLNLHRTEHRLRRLLSDFEWGRVDDVFLPAASRRAPAMPSMETTFAGEPTRRTANTMKHRPSEPGSTMTTLPGLIVRSLAAGDPVAAQRWDAFVAACPEATFFHRSGWQRIVDGVFGHRTHFLYAERAGRIEGILPLAHVRSRLFGNALVSLPFAVYGGVAAENVAAAAAIEAEALALAERLGVDHIEFRNITARHPDWPTQDLYVTFRKEIVPDVEANMLTIPRKQRAMVRKGIKNGLTGEIDKTVDRFFALYAGNVHRHGTPALPRTYFEALQREFGDDCEVLTVIAANGRPVSSVLSFYFRNEVLPYYAGDDATARELAANDFKYWDLMRRACEQGRTVFDYGRSKQGSGSYAFKKNWGFEPQPLHYEFRLYRGNAIPQNNPMNPKYRALIALWRKLPIGIATRLGPFIVRNLG